MPYYDLDKIITAARAQQIIYGGRKVMRDIANLGYSLKEVGSCISQLEVRHFNKTLYENN